MLKITENIDLRVMKGLKILKLISTKKPIARVDLASITGLNKATVSTITKELLDLGLIQEGDFGGSSGGRRPIKIDLCCDVGYTLCIDIVVQNVTLAILDLKFETIYIEKMQYLTNDFYLFFTQLCEQIDLLIKKVPPSRYGLVGLGISIHSVVDLHGNIKFFPEKSWRNIQVKSLLESRYDIPVLVDSDGNFSAYAQQMEYPDVKELLTLNISDVITGGILSDGKLVKGFLGYAGSIGHQIIDCNYTQNCTCGKRGCLEQFCSNKVILEQINKHKKVDNIEQFIALAQAKDINALRILDDFIKYLAIGITNMIFLLNSEIIILSSPVLDAFPHLLESLNESLLLPITKTQKIYLSRMQKNAPLIGVGLNVVDNFYSQVLSQPV